jgi:hypothetical protein
MLGAQADARTIGEPQPAALGLALGHLEALGPPDALHALGVHLPASHLQEAGDAFVALAAEAAREADDGRRQGVLVVTQRQLVALRGANLAEGTAGTPFGDLEPLTDRRHALAAA